MKIKSIIITSSLVFIGIISYLIYDIVSINNNYVLNDKKSLNINNFLAIMLETTAGSKEYQESDSSDWPSSDYIFNETLSKCSNGSTLAWDSENNAVIFSGVSVDACYVYFDIVDNISQVCESGDNLASCLKTLGSYNPEYTKIYYHDSNLENGANDNSYRYSGASSEVNNYVCFGSEEDTCPDDNLYRIIGVFDNEVKLVKASYYSSGDTWEDSTLETKVLSNFSSTWQEKIVSHTWAKSANEDVDLSSYTAKEALAYEKITSDSTTYVGKIGLIYPSDYGFANIKLAWTYTLSSYVSVTEISGALYDWLFLNVDSGYSWTMVDKCTADDSDDENFPFCTYAISPMGSVSLDNRGDFSNGGYAFPSFYLNSSITYLSGVGTSSSPIMIS